MIRGERVVFWGKVAWVCFGSCKLLSLFGFYCILVEELTAELLGDRIYIFGVYFTGISSRGFKSNLPDDLFLRGDKPFIKFLSGFFVSFSASLSRSDSSSI